MGAAILLADHPRGPRRRDVSRETVLHTFTPTTPFRPIPELPARRALQLRDGAATELAGE